MKKETPTRAFSCEFCDIFKNTVFTEHLQRIASGTRAKAWPPNMHDMIYIN